MITGAEGVFPRSPLALTAGSGYQGNRYQEKQGQGASHYGFVFYAACRLCAASLEGDPRLSRMKISICLTVAARLLVAVAFTTVARPARAAKPVRPNLLFLFSDDQRADTIAAYGNPHIETPHLDRLAREGFSFRRTYCMGSTHPAVCQPSRAMLNSGRSLYRAPLDLRGVKILPEVLRESGYTTFGTGKWHNGRPSFARGFSEGRAVFFGGMSNHRRVPVVDLKADGGFTGQRIGDHFSSELFADAAIDFITRQPADRPFYCYVAFTAPHDPRMPPPPYDQRYRPQEMPLPKNFLPQHPFNNGWMTGRDEALAPWPRTPEVIRAQLADYYGMITHMDAQIGRILAALRFSGQADNTIVVFSSDHGLALGSHGLLGKQNLYDESMHSPLIFWGPGIPKHGSSDALVYLYDLFPTLCGLAGAATPRGIDGQDLGPLWRGEKTSLRNSLFTAYEDVQRAVRDDRWKLIRYPKINKSQLFDLTNDPYEMTDLSSAPEQVATLRRMTGLLRRWQQRVGDRQPLSSAHPEPAEIDLTGHPRKPDRHQPPEVVRKYFPKS